MSPTLALVLPLPRGTVFLPGVAHRLAVSPSRLDIPALVSSVYQHAAGKSPDSPSSPNSSSSPSSVNSMSPPSSPDEPGKPTIIPIKGVPIVCVPHRSPLIGPDGQLLIQDGSHSPFVDSSGSAPTAAADDGQAGVNPADFFGYATMAKIVGFEGSSSGELGLIIETMGRVKMAGVTQEVPHYAAMVEPVLDQVSLRDPQLRDLFTLLKTRSAELVTMHIASLISRPYAAGPVQLANVKRVGVIVKNSQLKDAGALADLMVSVIDATYEEKLQLLATLHVKTRVVKAIELLERQANELKAFFKAASLAAVPIRIVTVANNNGNRGGSSSPSWSRNNHIHHLFPPIPGPSSSGPPSPPQWDDSHESNELDELRRKLDAAGMPADAAKLALKELRRLHKMAPSNQEHQVLRNWLDTMVEIPWSAVTPDRLDKDTLARARAQLDRDHHGLDKVKRRLVEYLAVLRLKKSVSGDAEAQIKRLEHEIAQAGSGATRPRLAITEMGELTSSSSSSDVAGAGEVAVAIQPDAAIDDAIEKSKKALDSLKNRRVVDKAPILLLAGPPGVGKTSLARSVATALGRKFHRISLGGVRDEAEIRGHRRTYLAAMPGILVQALRKVGVANPVILLDEIDKLAPVNNNGDPAAALLEVLDPEQNHNFTDHFVGTPVDLSRVLFITTANDIGTIPGPLLDRLETINLPGYTTIEKRHIAGRHLIPKQVAANGLAEGAVVFPDEVATKIIESYTRESGVRNLEREIGAVCRHKAVEFAEARDAGRLATYRPRLAVSDIETILGPARFEEELAESSNRPGVVTGLVAYSSGGAGSILFIEAADMPGDGSVQLTGQLGDVLRESVSVALSWVKRHAFALGLTDDPAANVMHDRSVHIHCPAGAVPKDGPSSGVAQAIALLSLFSDRPVPATLAMTGELSLRGRVLPVGGVKEKLIGALRAGIKTAIVPARNRSDVADLPQEVRDGIEILLVSHVSEAVRLVWPDWNQNTNGAYTGYESRL